MKIGLVFCAVFLTFGFSIPAQAKLNPVCEQFFQSPNHSKEAILGVIETALRKSGDKILALRHRKDFQVMQKEHFADLKTNGDCASQEIILKSLSENLATQGSRFIAEEKCSETTALLESSTPHKQTTWILDPIDGTTNYAHGMPHFGISLAFAVQDQLCLGAVYAPVFNEFFYAFVGHGAFLKRSTENEAEKIHVSAINQLASSLWITGTEGGPKSQAIEKNKATFDIALNLLPITHDLRRTGSAALDLAAIASGRAEGYLELSEGLNWWDIAAGVVLVEEGGGEVTVKSPNQRQTNVFAKPIIYILATNGQKQIHERINLLILKKTRP